MAQGAQRVLILTTIGNLDKFDPNLETFEQWFNHFEEFCNLNHIEDEPTNNQNEYLAQPNRRRSLFLTHVGRQAEHFLYASLAPHMPRNAAIPTLCDLLLKKFDDPGLVETNRIKFKHRIQQQNESVFDYINALQSLAQKCGWQASPDIYNQCLKTQLIEGLRNPDIKVKLLSPDITYVQARDLALQEDAVRQHMRKLAQQQTQVSVVSVKKGHQPQQRIQYTRGSTRGNRPNFRGTPTPRGNPTPRGSPNFKGTPTPRGTSAPRGSATPRGAPATRGGRGGHHQVSHFNECYRCGRLHNPDTCLAKQWQCYKCNRYGHVSHKCYTRNVHMTEEVLQSENDDLEAEVNNLVSNSAPYVSFEEVDVIQVNVDSTSQSPSVYLKVSINNKVLQAEIDTGAGVSLISQSLFTEHFPNSQVSPCQVMLMSASGPLPVVGQTQCLVSVNQSNPQKLQLIVCQTGSRDKFLVGRPWLDIFFPLWRNIFAIQNVNSVLSVKDVIKSFQESYPLVFNESNDTPIKYHSAKLVLKENVIALRHPPYSVPYAYIDIINKKLDALEQSGKVTKVSFSEYASPVVLVKKKTGDYRMCIDFKKTLNQHLNVDSYPLPVIEDIFASLADSKVFTVLDLSDAYMQLELHPDSRHLVTINTHKGLYQFKRLVYGIASAPAIFQNVMDDILRDVVPKVHCYLDDILIPGKDLKSCVELTKQVLSKLNDYNVRLKMSKCVWFVNSVNYLGYEISGEGRKPNPSKVKQVLELATPTTSKLVSTFIGMLSYYSPFLPNLSTVISPLRQLTKQGVPFKWSPDCDKAFHEAKNMLSSDAILTHFDPKLPIVVTADASPVGLGCILNHIVIIDKVPIEKPVIFASCTLTAIQQSYSQIDREAFALVFAVTRFRKFLLGRKFTLCTDNDPIRHILNPAKGVPVQASMRLQHWSLILQSYQFDLCHRKSDKMLPVDTLSRLPSSNVIEDSMNVEILTIGSTSDNSLPLNVSVIAMESAKDPVVSKVMQFTHTGWYPSKPSDLALLEFYNVRLQLSLEKKCLMFGNRVVIPVSLRKQVLILLHEGHPGMVRMKSLSRMYVWWPNLSTDIEMYVHNCNSCAIVNFKETNVFIPWPSAKSPFERVHVDFFELQSVKYFILCDSYSKWLYVTRMVTTRAQDVITVLLSIFATVGLPQKLVADNGPPFESEEFVNFLTSSDIILMHSPPYHPESNGFAEKSVSIAKKALRKLILDVIPSSGELNPHCELVLDQYVSSFLSTYRNTPTTTTNKTPNQLLFSYQPRTKLSILNPSNSVSVKSLPFKDGDKVIVKLRKKGPTFEAIIVKYLGGTRYLVSASGVVKEAHFNQISHASPL